MKNISLVIVLALFFAGCGSKNYYKPQKIDETIAYNKTLKAKLTDASRDGATLQNGQVISKNSGLLEIIIPKGFRFVNISDEGVVISSNSGEMKIISKDKTIFEKNFDKQLVAAALKNNLLAMVFIDNEIMLYDIKEGRLIYKESLAHALAVDARVANPIFLNDLVIFATLDGRLLIMDAVKNMVLRDVAISNKELFNNVIFLEVSDNTLIAATSSKIISVDPKTIHNIDINVKDIIYQDNKVYVFTKSGHVILLDEILKKQKEIKFPFAQFLAVSSFKDKLYAVLKRGYLIEIEKDLSSYKVLKMPDEIKGSLFASGNKIYYDNHYIDLK